MGAPLPGLTLSGPLAGPSGPAPHSPALRGPTENTGFIALPSPGGTRFQLAPGTPAPHTAPAPEEAPSAGGLQRRGASRRRQPGRHLRRPTDPVASSLHSSHGSD
ncbi:hypothetical protein NDU88_003446 [Pleurodeles waltl]|uniref:Uncharacterized protein n=1 Tax=Pleurodeles waltl TaxID=8319 RepID=A0AAV7VH48_PLEWA|nr:hypothetical protein NDU88_003446 [Pleurodeles waltl]